MELNVRGRVQNLEWTLAGYRNFATDFINQEITMTSTQFLNLERVTTQGIEGSLVWKGAQWLVGSNFDFHRHIDGTTNEFLLNQGPNTINAFFDYSQSDRWNGGFFIRHILPQMRVTEGLPRPNEATLLDIRAGLNFEFYDLKSRASLFVNNLFNKQYFLPGSTLPGPGTEFFINFNMEI
jgi:outer membrane receptor protein involved in Fe transport